MRSRSSSESMVSSISSSAFDAAKGLLQEVETKARVRLETWAWHKIRVGLEIRVGLACAGRHGRGCGRARGRCRRRRFRKRHSLLVKVGRTCPKRRPGATHTIRCRGSHTVRLLHSPSTALSDATSLP